MQNETSTDNLMDEETEYEQDRSYQTNRTVDEQLEPQDLPIAEPNSSHRSSECFSDQLTEDESSVQNETSVENLVDQGIENELGNSNQTNSIMDQQLEPVVDGAVTETEIENDEAKNSFVVQMADDDSFAIDGLFSDSDRRNVDDDGLVSPSLANIRLAANQTAAINSKGQIEITEIIDANLTCKFIYGKRLIPLAPFYNVKIGDLVSGDIPFKENVSAL